MSLNIHPANETKSFVAVNTATTQPAQSFEMQAAVLANAPSPEESRRQLKAALESLNEQMRSSSHDLQFSYDEQLDRSIITVHSQSTGKIVRQIPDAGTLKVAHSIETLKGVLLDEVR